MKIGAGTMLSCSVRQFTDPEQYEATFVATKAEIVPIKSGPFEARVSRVKLHSIWLGLAEENLPRIKHARQSQDRAFFTFLTRNGPEVITSGAAMPRSGLIRHSLGHSYYERSVGPIAWGFISLAVEDLAGAGIAAGRELEPPRESLRVEASAEAVASLRRVHAGIAQLAETAPDLVTKPEVARSLEQSLTLALAGCCAGLLPDEDSWSLRCHETVMRRFRRVLGESAERPLYLPEVCAKIRVSERTLRICCQEQLGMSPRHYLTHRRLHLAQRALVAADPSKLTVTEIATRFGFWHFGRFSAYYRSVVGESPSTTLNRLPA
jgi:AraC-like DNA-binding protein